MEGTIGEIRLFAGNFAPRNWAFCNGQLLSIAQNTALFSILGITYGGDGRTTFALPDTRGRVVVSSGQGPGLTFRPLGGMFGTPTNTLISINMPMHNHTVNCNNTAASGAQNSPQNAYMGVGPVDRTTGAAVNTRYAATPNTTLNPMAVGVTGSSQSFNNIQPSLGLYYIICMYGIFPSRN